MAGGTRKASRARQPITRHPLFAAIVALWFCALFGLGSLAIRVTLLENAVVASGIDLVVPAAAPPLGVTARILLALILGLIGSLIGYALGTRIGRVRPEPPQRRRTTLSTGEAPAPRRSDRFISAAGPPPRPLSAFEELGDHTARIATPELESVSPRRRALAMTEPTEPDYGRINAPLPGGDAIPMAECLYDDDAGVLELADALPEETLVPDLEPNGPVTPNEHAALAPEAFQPALAPTMSAPTPADQASGRLFDQGATARRFAQPEKGAFPATAESHNGDLAATARTAMPRLMAADPVAVDDNDLGDDDRGLPPRNLGLRFGAPPAASVPAPEPEPAPEPIESVAPQKTAETPAVRPVTGSAAERLRATPLDNLSQLELIERLALSMQARRTAAEAAAAKAAAPVEPQFPPVAEADALPRFGFEPREPLPLDQPPQTFAMPQSGPLAASIPVALRPIGFDEEPLDDLSVEDLVPHLAFARPAASAPELPAMPAVSATSTADDVLETEDAVAENEGLSSLLDLGRTPLRQPLIRIEEPVEDDAPIEPVVVFPGHGSRPFAAPAPAAQAPEPAPQPAEPVAGRRFDAPALAPGAATPAPAAAASRQDPEETERALRAALATLQRMSGAA